LHGKNKKKNEKMTAKPFHGQVAIVTGSSRRIGRATALALARDGAAVVINARTSRREAEDVAAEVAALGGRALVQLADVADEEAVTRMTAEAVRCFGRIDILVNNAGMRGQRPFLEMTLQHWRELIGVDLDGAFLCSRAVLRHMVASKYGRIVNIGGSTAHIGRSLRTHIGAAKTGLVGLTRALATEFATHGVTVNCVVPGRIGGSAMSQRVKLATPPVGREGTAEEVAELIRTLCLPTSGFITGQTIHISGGLVMP
jgi:3-oxoacyl-[acyl-carrier protein] reductase